MGQAPRGRVFYGWWIVAVSMVVTMLHVGATFYAFGRFIPTLVEEFNSGLTAVSAAGSVYMLIVGITGPIAGKLTDRYGPKKLIIVGAAIAGAGLMLLSVSRALWHLYVFFFVVGIGMSGAGFVPVSVAISNWFTKRRGVAMGIAMAGVSVGAILIAPLAHYLIIGFGWRMAFVVLGLMTAVLIIVPSIFLMRNRPEEMGLLPDGVAHVGPEPVSQAATVADPPAPNTDGSPGVEGYTLARAFRTPAFWLVLATFLFAGIVVVGVLQHEVNILKNMGVPLAAASFALGFTGGIGGVGKVVFGALGDRLTPRYASIICIALQLVGLVLLMLTHTTVMVWVFVVVYGFAMGGWLTMEPLVTAELFGMKSFAAIYGWVLAAAAVGSGLGPILMGAVYDLSGSYTVGLVICLGAYVMAIAALSLARKPKPAVAVATL
ncbi:MAG: MFS transporter [Chloroflexota bacterium]|nr:MFS transporter [Chloroflexota bacterium]